MGSYPKYKVTLFFLIVKTYKLLFISTIIIRTLISISAYSWLGIWLGLEINLLSIIPLIHNQKNILSSESAIKYFVVQSIASTIILLSVIILINKSRVTTNVNLQSTFLIIINSRLLTKMGIAPFHFWFPEVIEGLDWINCLLILTWQKIAPIVLLIYNIKFITFIFTVIIASIIIRGIMGVNQVSLRKIIAYSSINHIGWIIRTILIIETIWIYYFVIYTVISINIVLILKTFNIFYLNQLFQSINSRIITKIFFILNFLSLRGVPPFLGFLPKWLTVQALVQNNIILIPTLIIILTLITIFIYIRITLSRLLINVNEINWNQINSRFRLNKFYLASINFFTITRLLVVTLTFNIL